MLKAEDRAATSAGDSPAARREFLRRAAGGDLAPVHVLAHVRSGVHLSVKAFLCNVGVRDGARRGARTRPVTRRSSARARRGGGRPAGNGAVLTTSSTRCSRGRCSRTLRAVRGESVRALAEASFAARRGERSTAGRARSRCTRSRSPTPPPGARQPRRAGRSRDARPARRPTPPRLPPLPSPPSRRPSADDDTPVARSAPGARTRRAAGLGGGAPPPADRAASTSRPGRRATRPWPSIAPRPRAPTRSWKRRSPGWGPSPAPTRSASTSGPPPAAGRPRCSNGGARVVAVDRAPLAPPLARDARVSMVIGNAFNYTPPAPVDWLVSDVVCEPPRSLDLIGRWLEQNLCRNLVVTVKFKGRAGYGILDDAAAAVRAPSSRVRPREAARAQQERGHGDGAAKPVMTVGDETSATSCLCFNAWHPWTTCWRLSWEADAARASSP